MIRGMLKKAIAVVMAGTMLLGGITASAENTSVTEEELYFVDILPERERELSENSSEPALEAAIREYADNMIASYVSGIFDLTTGESVLGDFYVTDIIPQYDWEKGGELAGYFVFVSFNGTMTGQLVIRYYDNKLISTFYQMNDPEIHELLINKTPFQLGCGYGCFYLYENGKFTIIDSDFSSPTNTSGLKADPSKMVTAGYDYAIVTVSQTYSETVQTEGGGLITKNDKTASHKYISSERKLKRGWNDLGGKIYYVKADGSKAVKSCIIDGIRYKFTSDGECHGKYTGWTKSDKGRRYWKNGILLKNRFLRTKGGLRYYADENGYVIRVINASRGIKE